MKCPYCGFKDDKVVDSRVIRDGHAIRRRRECLSCNRRFTTYEFIEKVSLMVIKKDGRREAFDISKIKAGVVKACEKRQVSVETIEGTVEDIEKEVGMKYEKEVPSSVIGELVMIALKKLDEVAYVRFASVYRQFKDINDFIKELRTLLEERTECLYLQKK